MQLALRNWLRIALFNLLLVASIGVTLRYKIAYSLPFVNQKYLMQGHSHFAFAGWVSLAIMALMVATLSEQLGKNQFRRYRAVLTANLLTAYGMLISFPAEGYGFFAILCSTLSIFASYAFALQYWTDLKRLGGQYQSSSWFKVALASLVLSSIGPFSLAYMMATKNHNQNFYLATIYVFLHFQYNGWFFFGCMGLLVRRLSKAAWPKRIFMLFSLALVPCYFLSLLWWPLPAWLYAIVVLATLGQFVGWILVLIEVRKQASLQTTPPDKLVKFLLILCGIATTIKFCLQTGSVVPSLSKLAFGFRPIVIGYLHLVMLGMITLFLITYFLHGNLIRINKTARTGIIVFTAGIFLNEILLMIQGIYDINMSPVSGIDEGLLIAALVLFGGLAIINYSQISLKDDPDHKTSGLS